MAASFFYPTLISLAYSGVIHIVWRILFSGSQQKEIPMLIKTRTFFIATFLLATTLPAHAEYSQRHSGMHQQNQYQSIWRGIRSGRITNSEFTRITRQQNELALLKHKFRRDGIMSKKERKILKRKTARLNKTIRRSTANDNARYQSNRSNGYSSLHSNRWPSSNHWWKRSYN